MTGQLRVSPMRPEYMESLSACAAADGHSIIAPTYLLEKDSNIIGYVGTIPSVLIWLDTQKAKVRDAYAAMNFYENQLAANGAQIIGVPCKQDSPLYPYMERVGYVKSDKTTLFLKNLNP